jgi:hypothetical protein
MWLAAFVVARGNSRFLTGLSARFGMTFLFIAEIFFSSDIRHSAHRQ